MAFEREVWQAFITNNSGDIQPNAQITVFDAGTSNLSTIYSELTGSPRSNPFNIGSDGLAKFYAEPARYQVQAQSDAGIAVFDDVDLSQKAHRDDLASPDSESLIAGKPAKDIASLRDDLAQMDSEALISGVEARELARLNELPIAGTFEAGFTITDKGQFAIFKGAEADGSYMFRWDGALPKEVPANSSPDTTGGVDVGAWVDAGQAALRSELADADSTVLISDEQASDVASIYKQSVAAGARVKDIPGAALKTVSGEDKRTQNRAVASFTFDDGYSTAIDVIEPAFDSRGINCGFAVTYSRTSETGKVDINKLLSLQRKGYEVLSHALTGTTLRPQDATSESEVRAELNNSHDFLEKLGLKIKGFVANSSVLDPSFSYVLSERYNYAFVRYKGDVGGESALQDSDLNPRDMFRTSCFSIGLQGCKDIVDLAVQNGGMVNFYDHDPSLTNFPNSMPIAELEELLDYCILQGLDIVIPSQAVDMLHSSTIKSEDIKAVAEGTSLVRYSSAENGIFDDSFVHVRDASSPAERYSSNWLVIPVAVTGSQSTSFVRREIGSELRMTFDGAHTAGAGSVSVMNAVSDFLYDPRVVTFGCKLRSNAAYITKFDCTLEIQLRNASDNSVIQSVSTENIKLLDDGTNREFSVTLNTDSSYISDSYFCFLIRSTPKSDINLSSVLVVSEPRVNYSSELKPYQKSSRERFLDAEGTFSATSIPSSTRTKLLASSTVYSPHSINSGTFTFSKSGAYSVFASCSMFDLPAGERLIISARVNGDAIDRFQTVGFAGESGQGQVFTSFNYYFAEGDTLEFFVFQQSGQVQNTSSDLYSRFNIMPVNV